jgi:flagellar biosynthetic protein FliR
MELTSGFLPGATRVAGLFLAAPLFSSKLLPMRFRIAAAALFLAASPGAHWGPAAAGETMLLGISPGRLAGEAVLGIALGWSSCLIMAAARGAACLIADHAGFTLGAVVDPLAEAAEPPLRTFHGAFAIFVFTALGLDHEVLRLAGESFRRIPPGSLGEDGVMTVLATLIPIVGTRLLESALWIAFPVLSVLFLVSVVQGILGRAAPELDLHAFGLPLRAIACLVAVLFGLPRLAEACQSLLAAAARDAREVLAGLGG